MRTKTRIPNYRNRSVTVMIMLFTIASLVFSGATVTRSQDPVETIRIESDLVDLKVSVLGLNQTLALPLLDQKDFHVFEDGTPQEISFFAAADAPFDLVLLLDLSGSSSKKLKMIRRSAKRFVDAARPVDRIAIVTFTDQVFLLSEFTLNRKQLKKDIDYIDDAFGGTSFWDALNYVLKDLVGRNQGSRRSAVVVMTDGVDNALPEVSGPGSSTTYEELIANVRGSEAIVFPIYLEVAEKDLKKYKIPPAAYAQAQQQVAEIASTSGTTLYRATRLEDLELLYQQVIRDLGTVYSIGYRPSNRALDGKWRTVQVQLPGRPALQARTKRGYFAKLEKS